MRSAWTWIWPNVTAESWRPAEEDLQGSPQVGGPSEMSRERIAVEVGDHDRDHFVDWSVAHSLLRSRDLVGALLPCTPKDAGMAG